MISQLIPATTLRQRWRAALVAAVVGLGAVAEAAAPASPRFTRLSVEHGLSQSSPRC